MSANRCLRFEAGLGLVEVVPFKGEWINELYVHDDQTGPFARLLLTNPSAVNMPVTMHCSKWSKPDGSPRSLTVFAALIPLCSAIRIGFSDIAAIVKKISGLLDTNAMPDLVWDVFLTESNSYKEEVRVIADSEVPSLEEVLISSHPRYIWCSRLSSPNGMQLEVLYDATNVYGALPAYIVRWGSAALKTSINTRLVNHRLVVREGLGSKLYDWLLARSS